ncbi:MAG TPA: hypothetical protein VNA66_11415 [Gammaproteobacteria bacterium]|nr:hypothetical protein [Gammaproteobacteria bacterium]
MTFPKKLLRLRPTRGVAADPAANEVGEDFYTGASNVLFRSGFAGRMLGSRAAYGTLPVDVLHMLNARIGSTNFWLFFGADEIHANETSNSDDVTGAALTTVSQPHQWSSTLLNGVPVATNSLDAPRYWAGDVGTPFATLPGWPASTLCKSIIAFRFHLVAFDIDGPSGHFESQVLWSDAAEPGTVPAEWTAAADNEAGDATLGDTPGPILCSAPLRGSLLIYKRVGVYSMDYVGGEEVFAFRQVFSAAGALTRHAVAELPDGRHFVVGDGDIYITDGVSRRSVAQDRMRDFVFNQLDQDNYENLFVIYHRAKNEVWVCFPEQGSQYCTLAAVYDVAHDAFGVLVLADVTCAAIGVVNDTASSEGWVDATYTWADAARLWNQPNYSLAVESLVIGYGTTAEQQDTQDAVELAASISRYDLTFGEPERVKFVRRVHVRAKTGFGTLYVRVGARMTPTDSITWATEVSLVEPASMVSAFALGRYISVEIRSDSDAVWEVSGIDLEADLRGYF